VRVGDLDTLVCRQASQLRGFVEWWGKLDWRQMCWTTYWVASTAFLGEGKFADCECSESEAKDGRRRLKSSELMLSRDNQLLGALPYGTAGVACNCIN
jgi:hypothetical protein